MRGISLGRLLAGGLLAGVILAAGETVLNQVILIDEWAAMLGDQDAVPSATWRSAAMTGILIAYGVVLIWIYAAIRPRFGPGPGTAIIASLTLWVIAWGLLGASFALAGMITPRIAVVSAIWGFLEVPIAALAGGWVYREAPQGSVEGLKR